MPLPASVGAMARTVPFPQVVRIRTSSGEGAVSSRRPGRRSIDRVGWGPAEESKWKEDENRSNQRMAIRERTRIEAIRESKQSHGSGSGALGTTWTDGSKDSADEASPALRSKARAQHNECQLWRPESFQIVNIPRFGSTSRSLTATKNFWIPSNGIVK